jgi:glycine/D-amino acid oxidase-like deaminating enzyme
MDLDTGAIFAQSGDGIVRATARDDDGRGLDRIASAFRFDPAPRLAALTHFSRLLTHDGAPAIGPTRRGRLFVVAGLGVLDIVLAPLLAAIISETASGVETEWAAAHGAERRQPRREIAEFVAGHVPGGAA